MQNIVKALQQYGQLLVLNHFIESTWVCLCSCGSTCMAHEHELLHGIKTDCGCVFRPMVAGHVGRNRYEYEGVVYTAEEIEAKFKIYQKTFLYRIYHGYSVVDAIQKPVRKMRITQRKPLC